MIEWFFSNVEACAWCSFGTIYKCSELLKASDLENIYTVGVLYLHVILCSLHYCLYVGMTKIKMSKEETGSNVFVEHRRAALERYAV